jgi:hypothetical protein
MVAAPCAPWHCVRGPVRNSGVAGRSTRSLGVMRTIAMALACLGMISIPSWALDQRTNELSGHLGRIQGWLLLPSVVGKHCAIARPRQAEKIRAAEETWRSGQAVLIQEVEATVQAAKPFYARLLGVSPNEAQAWMIDSTTMTVEEVHFWQKSVVDVWSMCYRYNELIAKHSDSDTVGKMRESLDFLNSNRKYWAAELQ